MPKLKITKQYANEFNESCAKSDAYNFLKFITKPYKDNIKVIDLISKVEKSIKPMPNNYDREFILNEQILSTYMNEFFSLYIPHKAEQVRAILDKTHPFFIDSDGGEHINFIYEGQNFSHSSNVNHRGRRSFLELNVYMHNSYDDLRTTAHEISHALSSHHQYLIKMIRSNATKSQIDKYAQKDFRKDCIIEIESLITEQLFNEFLVKKGLYTNVDLENYENGQQTSLLNEVNLIREETDIMENLSYPVTYESLNKLIHNLQKDKQDRLIDRIDKMHNDSGKHSAYMFRYVVGRVVANQWMKRFNETQSKQTKYEMLETFQNYLDRTYELTLDNACEYLLGQDFTKTVEDFIKDKNNETTKIDEKEVTNDL